MMEMANDNRDGDGMEKAAQGWDGMGWESNNPPTAAATWMPSNSTKMTALNDNAKENRRWR